MRNLLAIAAAVLFVWLVCAMATTRLQWLDGPTVIASVVGNQRSSGRSPADFPVLRYRLPADWPVAAGSEQVFVVGAVQGRGGAAIGADVQLKLQRQQPLDPAEYSLLGIWGVFAAVLFFGSGLLLILVTVLSPSPTAAPRVWSVRRRARPQSKPRQAAPDAPPRRSRRVIGWSLLALFVSFFLFPWMLGLLGPLLFLLLTSLLLVSALLALFQRLLDVAMPGRSTPGSVRPGLSGLLVDLSVHSLLAVLMAGFLLASGLGVISGLDRFLPGIAWSWSPLNSLRTALWLPQDLDRALCAAVARSDAATARWLVAHGARSETVCGTGDNGVKLTATLLLLDDPQATLQPQAVTDDALRAAVETGTPAQVQLLLDRGANPNIPLGDRPLLAWAVDSGQIELLDPLLAAGADPDALTPGGDTVFTEAAAHDQVDLVPVLIRRLHAAGANLDALDSDGRTALLRHAMKLEDWHLEVVDLLLELGANPNIPDRAGLTALDHRRLLDATDAADALAAKGGRSGRIQAGGDAVAISADPAVVSAVRTQLEQMSGRAVSDWQPAAAALQLSTYEAGELRPRLPVDQIEITGWMTGQRASPTVCGRTRSNKQHCFGMELRNRPPEASAGAEAEPTAVAADAQAATHWTVIAVWQDYAQR